MKYSVSLQPEARQDIQNAIDWYESKQFNLGTSYFQELVETINIIAQNPAIFQVRYREVRIAFLNKFPFGVHFKIDDNRETIVILAVLHTSQNPQIWLDRG